MFVTFFKLFEYGTSMVQQNLYLFNPNDFRVGPLAYDGAKTLIINSGTVSRCSHSTKMYLCEYCTKPFNQKSHLLRHKREVREWKLRFDCEKCEKKFKRKEHFDQYKPTCCRCQRCHIQFKSPQEKKSHVCEPATKKPES